MAEEARVDVDSGTLLIIDPCYLPEDVHLTVDGHPWRDVITDRGVPVSCATDVSGFARGVLARTAHGDGSYAMRLERDDEGRPARLVIDLEDGGWTI